MIPLETQFTVWLNFFFKLIRCSFLFVLIYYYKEKKKGKLSETKIKLIQIWAKKGTILCFTPAILLLMFVLVLQIKGFTPSTILFDIALNLGMVVYLVNFIRLFMAKK